MRSGDPPGYAGEAVEPFDHADQSNQHAIVNRLPLQADGVADIVLMDVPRHFRALLRPIRQCALDIARGEFLYKIRHRMVGMVVWCDLANTILVHVVQQPAHIIAEGRP